MTVSDLGCKSLSPWRRIATVFLITAALIPLAVVTSSQRQAEAYCVAQSSSSLLYGSAGRADENSRWASTCDGDFRYFGSARDDAIDSKSARVDASTNASNWTVLVNTGTDTNYWLDTYYTSTTSNTSYLRTCVQSAIGSTGYICGVTVTNKGY